MILYLSNKNNIREYHSESGNKITNFDSKNSVVISLEDCHVLSLNLPPLKESEMEPLIERQLSSHFPHSIDDMKWYYTNNKGKVRIYLIKEELLNSIYADLGDSTKILSPAQAISWDEGKHIYVNRTPVTSNLFFSENGDIKHAFPIHSETELNNLISEYKEDENITNLPNLSQQNSLFIEKKRKKSPWLLTIIPIILALIYFGAIIIDNNNLRKTIEEQNSEILNLQSEILTIDDSEYPWEESLVILEDSIPDDYYARIELLYSYFLGRAVIKSIAIQNDKIRIQASGIDSLKIMDELENLDIWEDLYIDQIKSEYNGELFTFTGKFK